MKSNISINKCLFSILFISFLATSGCAKKTAVGYSDGDMLTSAQEQSLPECLDDTGSDCRLPKDQPEAQIQTEENAMDSKRIGDADTAGCQVNEIYDTSYSLCTAIEMQNLSALRTVLKSGSSIQKSHCFNDETFYQLLKSKQMHCQGLNGNDIRMLIKAGMDVNDQKNSMRHTPLMVTAKFGLTDAFKALLEAGANISAVNDEGKTALHYAAFGGVLENVNLLIQNKADVNASDLQKRTPLMHASTPEIASALIQAGADIKALSEKSENALLMSLKQENNEETALFLMKSGADINAATYIGRTPMMFAIEHKYHKVLDALIQTGADIHAKEKDGNTPLMFAARVKDAYAVRQLIDHGARVNDITNEGTTALMHSLINVEENSDENLNAINDVVDILISHGADINAVAKKHITALSLAVTYGNARAVEKLIQLKANISPDCEDCPTTELRVAMNNLQEATIEKKRNEIIINMFENGDTLYGNADDIEQNKKDINRLNREISDYQKICELLIEAGANLTQEHSNKMLIKSVVNPYLTRQLLKFGANPNLSVYGDTPLTAAISMLNPESMQELINAGADISDSHAVFFASLLYGNEETTRKLLDNGLKVDQPASQSSIGEDLDDMTLLMFTAKLGDQKGLKTLVPEMQEKEIVKSLKLLLKAGADVNAKNQYGKTALHYAAEAGNSLNVKALLDGGADKNIKDLEGRTPLDYAIKSGCHDCMQYLQQ